MWLVAGLGNPGRRYARTRHNAGYEVVDELARRSGVVLRRSWRYPLEWATVSDEAGDCLLVKPRSYMNRSGPAISPLVRRKRLALADLIVVVDDVDLSCGRIRVRPRGSGGGHNGLKSLIAALGSDAFARVRVGVGGPPGGRSMVEHVLGGYTSAERQAVDEAVRRAAAAVGCIRRDGLDRAMNEYNG